jgi:siroheme decarboxylase
MSDFEDWEIALIRALNGPLPLCPEPFAAVAEKIGITEEQVLERVRAWKEDGTIRRFGARVNHRRLGFSANGMSVWDVPEEDVERVGAIMTEQPEVSHCYLRPRNASWPYNLYAMIHGKNEDEVRAVAQRIAKSTGFEECRVLFSATEFKKSAPRYFAEGKVGQGGSTS